MPSRSIGPAKSKRNHGAASAPLQGHTTVRRERRQPVGHCARSPADAGREPAHARTRAAVAGQPGREAAGQFVGQPYSCARAVHRTVRRLYGGLYGGHWRPFRCPGVHGLGVQGRRLAAFRCGGERHPDGQASPPPSSSSTTVSSTSKSSSCAAGTSTPTASRYLRSAALSVLAGGGGGAASACDARSIAASSRLRSFARPISDSSLGQLTRMSLMRRQPYFTGARRAASRSASISGARRDGSSLSSAPSGVVGRLRAVPCAGARRRGSSGLGASASRRAKRRADAVGAAQQ